MIYRVTIERANGEVVETQTLGGSNVLVPAPPLQTIYQQTVEDMDVRAVMYAVNKRPRKSRAKIEKIEKGKSALPDPPR